jgi:signal peptidase I
MATTLMGRHKDLECPACHYWFRVAASGEVDDYGRPEPQQDVIRCTCPRCGRSIDVDPQSPDPEVNKYQSYKGDRIIVAKFPFGLAEPKRWDVTVFKFPGRAQDNYIKRMVGLPNETVRLQYGNVYTAPKDSQEFQIERKPPKKIRAMLQEVHDNSRPAGDNGAPIPDVLVTNGWPSAWQACPDDVDRLVEQGWPRDGAHVKLWPKSYTAADGGFSTNDGYASFSTDGTAAGETWMRFQYRRPADWSTPDDLARQLVDHLGRPIEPGPTLVDDSYAYNEGATRERPFGRAYPHFWVGDLGVECEVEVKNNAGELVLELIRGGKRFQCRFDLAQAQASLWAAGTQLSSSPVDVRGPDRHTLLFANVDDQLHLWVDDDYVEFPQSTYDPAKVGCLDPSGQDLSPVGIASRGASVRVSDMRVVRDVYYVAQRNDLQSQGNSPLPHGHYVDFPLAEDQFFMLGDNSPSSLDSRLWIDRDWARDEYYVRRDLLVGKAVYVYWPHGWEELGNTGIPIYLQLFPNFKRMRLIH